MQDGWIKLWRKIFNNPIFDSKDHALFKTFIYCLGKANHKENKTIFNNQIINLQPGQFITGRESASRDLHFDGKMFDRKLKILEKMEILTRKVTNKYSIINIINWNTYQGSETADDQLPDQQTTSYLTSKRPADDQLPDHRQEVKNDKNEKNIKKNTLARFEIFYKAYPKKKSKGQAEKTWLKIKPDEKLFQKILSQIELFKNCEEWTKNNGKYIPYPATWLNAKGWEDELSDIGYKDGMDLWLKIKEEQDERKGQKEIQLINEKTKSDISGKFE